MANKTQSSRWLLDSDSKPVKSILRIIEVVDPFSEKVKAGKGIIFPYINKNQQFCYILHNGTISVNRRGDGIILNHEQGPVILGLISQLSSCEKLYIKVQDDSQMSTISLHLFNLLVKSYQLWEDVCKCLIYNTSRIFEHCERISNMSSFDLVCFQLNELIKESEQVRMNTTAANYIINRSYLSRSGVMRILAQLRDAGCITLDRGKLVAIHSLPSAGAPDVAEFCRK